MFPLERDWKKKGQEIGMYAPWEIHVNAHLSRQKWLAPDAHDSQESDRPGERKKVLHASCESPRERRGHNIGAKGRRKRVSEEDKNRTVN